MKSIKKVVLVLSGLIVLGGCSLLAQNLTAPSHLGHQNGQLAPMPDKPNAVSTQTDQTDKRVEPLPARGSREATMVAVVAVLEAMGGNEIQRQDGPYLYSVFTTPVMRYRDDVEFYIDEANGVLHFRSQSRAGYSDMGVNRKRYEQFRELYLR
ncbi:DUF1499 domain-containing protein [Pseudomaricurvus alkylphenolicus]|jgi:uncharacterized protein (DUF1499 family)|uniref:DUF1499 domain-containing protein n=1 Tax=Pseudomaricurvus alkylphenolicus TaxID=1306991 RepID=UPI001423D331|nr:DUF1499 domain-containing protein [Pseudomaricurvus alkylphenolicus]NIB41636.1 DUF1499 domain-containing protein [Pseudomaricurvus alkylphenolicus]